MSNDSVRRARGISHPPRRGPINGVAPMPLLGI